MVLTPQQAELLAEVAGILTVPALGEKMSDPSHRTTGLSPGDLYAVDIPLELQGPSFPVGELFLDYLTAQEKRVQGQRQQPEEQPSKPRLSYSQMDWFRSCRRKWAFGYLDRIKTPPNRWANLGKLVHDVLEQWLKRGVPPNRETEPGAIALPGLKFLPKPGEAYIEGRFLWELPDEPFDLVGVMDWLEIDIPRVGDHKTTGNFVWVKSPEDLQKDIQATIYAKRALHLTGADECKGRWVYYHTRTPYKAQAVDWHSSAEQIEASFSGILLMGREMVEWHRRKAKAKDVPFNAKACDEYGGCPFRERCNLSAKERLVSLMVQESLKEKMARVKAERAAAKDAQPASVAEATTCEPAHDQAPPVTAAPINPPEGQGGAKVLIPSTRSQAAGSPQTLKEKMAARKAAASPPAPTHQPAAAVPTNHPAPAPDAERSAAAVPTAAQAHPVQPAASPSQQTEASSFMATAQQPETVQLPPAQLAMPANQTPGFQCPGAPQPKPIKMLLIDCAPVQGDGLNTVSLPRLLHDANGNRLTDHLFMNAQPCPLAVTVMLNSEQAQAHLDELMGLSETVIRGN